MTLTKKQEEKIHVALAALVDSTPSGSEFDRLTDVELAGESPEVRRLRSVWAFGAAFLIVALVGGLLAWATRPGGPSNLPAGRTPTEGWSDDPSVFMVPSWIPAELSLQNVTMASPDGFRTDDPAEASLVRLLYAARFSASPNENPVRVDISINDRIADVSALLQREELACHQVVDGLEVQTDSETCRRQLEGSSCSGLARIEEGVLDPNACIEEFIENIDVFEPDGAVVTSERIKVRGQPALLLDQDGSGAEIEDSVSIMVYEGGPILSTVTGYQVDRATVREISESLSPVATEEFLGLASELEGQ